MSASRLPDETGAVAGWQLPLSHSLEGWHGIHFLATVHLLRAEGMTWMRLPLFARAMYATSLVRCWRRPCWR